MDTMYAQVLGASEFGDDWMPLGACRSYDDFDAFFPEGDCGDGRCDHLRCDAAPAPEQYREALDVCSGCPVRSECLSLALELHLVDGVWGGMTPPQREVLRKEFGLVPHGTVTGYTNKKYMCKCEPCRTAGTVARADRDRPVHGTLEQAA